MVGFGFCDAVSCIHSMGMFWYFIWYCLDMFMCRFSFIFVRLWYGESVFTLFFQWVMGIVW